MKIAIALFLAMILCISKADPAFECYDKRISKKTTYDFKEYQKCARNCEDCKVYEHMCLEKYDQFNFTLNHRSIQAESRCNPP